MLLDESDLVSLQEEIDLLADDIESYLHEQDFESIIHGFTILQISCEVISETLVIRHCVLTDCGDKVNINGNWEWRYLGTFDESHARSMIIDEFGLKYSEILNSFGIDVSDVTFSIEPYPDEGY